MNIVGKQGILHKYIGLNNDILNVYNSVYKTHTDTDISLEESISISDKLFPEYSPYTKLIATEGFVQSSINILMRIIEAILKLIKLLYRTIASIFSNKSSTLKEARSNIDILKNIKHNINLDLTQATVKSDFDRISSLIIPAGLFTSKVQTIKTITRALTSLSPSVVEHLENPNNKNVREAMAKAASLKSLCNEDVGFKFNEETGNILISKITEIFIPKVITTEQQLIEEANSWSGIETTLSSYYEIGELIKNEVKKAESRTIVISGYAQQGKALESSLQSELLFCQQLMTTFGRFLTTVESDITTCTNISNAIANFFSKYRKGVIE